MLPHMQRQLRREQDHLPPPPSFSCFRTSPLAPLSAVPSLSITPATPVPTLTEAHRSPLGHAGPLQHADEHGFTSVPISTFEVDDEKEQASTSTRRAESLVPSSRRFHRPSDTPSTTLPPVLPFTDPFSPLSPPAAAGKSTRRPRYLFFIPLLILVLVGIAVGLAVDLSRGSQGNVAPSGTKGGVPPSSLLPSAAPVTVMELAEQQVRGSTTTRLLAQSVQTARLLTAPGGRRGKSAATTTKTEQSQVQTEQSQVQTDSTSTTVRWSATGMRMGEAGGVVRQGKGPGAARLVQLRRKSRP